jgi:hypothetical protein
MEEEDLNNSETSTGNGERYHNVHEPGEFDALETFMCLLAGVALEGRDELVLRLGRWRDLATPSDRRLEGLTGAELTRLAIIGACFEMQDLLRSRLTRMWGSALRYAGRLPVAAVLLMPDTPIVPIGAYADRLALRGVQVVARWIAQGQAMEARGRGLARRATADLIDEILSELARQPAVRELVLQQGEGFASEALGEVRGRAEMADLWLERMVHGLLRRPANGRTRKPPARVVPVAPATEEEAHETSDGAG